MGLPGLQRTYASCGQAAPRPHLFGAAGGQGGQGEPRPLLWLGGTSLRRPCLSRCLLRASPGCPQRVLAERMAVRLNLNVRIVGGVGLYSEQHQLQELQVRLRRQLCTDSGSPI